MNMPYWLRAILCPACWIQNCPYSDEWDRVLNALMQAHKFVYNGRHVATLGDETVWVANHPYASFTPHSPVELHIRPSRATILKAHDKLVKDTIGKLA